MNPSYTISSFANAMRQQSPTGVASDGTPYASMSDDDLVKRVVAKYPVYQDQISDYGSIDNPAGDGAPGSDLPTGNGILGGIAAGIQQALPNTINALKNRATNLQNEVQNTNADVTAAGGGTGAKLLGAASDVGDVAGNALGGAGNIIGNAISPFLNPAIKASIGDVSGKISSAIDQIPGMTPEIKGKFADVFTGLTLALGEQAAPAVAAKASDLASGAVDTAGNVITGAKDSITGAASNIKEAISPSLTPEEQVGNIIQGKIKDIAPAQRTFDALPSDTPPISDMSPKELSNTIQEKIIEPNLSETDTKFANDTTTHPMEDFEQTTGTGNNEIKTNYVQEAIDQLKKFYTATKDSEGLSRITALEDKALGEPLTPEEINSLKVEHLGEADYQPPTRGEPEGLTSKELNDLAKEHGREIKGFNANGEAGGGITKQAAENVRTGLKSTARQILGETDPEGAAEAERLDKETSDAIKTKKLLDRQVEKENTSIQKNGKPNILDKNPRLKIAAKIGATAVAGEGLRRVITGGF